MADKKLVVIGGGAAGIFCAINAARLNPSLQVILFEKTGKLLSKVKVSGGGRCNVTHSCFDILQMSRQYPRGSHFIKKTFHRFFTPDTIQWFEERGVKLKTEKDGRMFPITDSSQTIIDCLMNEAKLFGVKITMHSEIKSLNVDKGKFFLTFSDDRKETSDFVCLATGGYPKSSMFDWLRELGHSIEDPVPSLFTFNMPGNSITKLMGVSVENAQVKIAGTKLAAQGPLLITHWGLSGPAILRLSAWGARDLAASQYHFTAIVNWLPGFNEQELKEKFQTIRTDAGSQKILNKNPFGLPQRLWQHLLETSEINPDTRWADQPGRDQNKLIKSLTSFECSVHGKTTFKEEFVTAGGINLAEVNANTMMSKKIPNLFYAGEVLNVDGITGGYNFQHAWTSGWIAAASVADLATLYLQRE
jgi:predicted Rossmann fold flavoprotein